MVKPIAKSPPKNMKDVIKVRRAEGFLMFAFSSFESFSNLVRFTAMFTIVSRLSEVISY